MHSIILSRVFTGSTDVLVFEYFVEQLLQHCGRWLELKSVRVRDNVSLHHSERIKEMYSEAGVELLYLPHYLPDWNPIEEFVSELKAYIMRHWKLYEPSPNRALMHFCRPPSMLLVHTRRRQR